VKLRDPRLALALVSLAAVVAVVVIESRQTSPGPLTTTHARAGELASDASCDQCHGDFGESMAQACAECHEEISEQLAQHSGFHGTRQGIDVSNCAACHLEHHGDAVRLVDARAFELGGVGDIERFVHDFTDFGLSGKHAALGCEACHPKARAEHLADGERRFGGLAQRCASCHEDPHQGRFVTGCEACHGQERPFAELASFVHTADMPLTGSHGGLACTKCHAKDSPYAVETLGGAGPKPRSRACEDCHESPHSETLTNAVAARFGTVPAASCSECHPPSATSFAVAEGGMRAELHAATGFALDRPHDRVACEECHAGYGGERAFAERYPGRRADDCAACHEDAHRRQFADASGSNPACVQCHTREAFEPHRFDVAMHARTSFALDGAHVRVECEECHERKGEAPRTFRGTSKRCDACHEDVHGGLFATLGKLVEGQEESRGVCAACHDTASFRVTRERFGAREHERSTAFALRGAHARAECETCHRPAAAPDALGRRFGRVADVFGTPATECATCHADVHRGAFELARLPQSVDGRATCSRCHSEDRFREMPHGFDHGAWTAFALEGAHARADCARCHGTMLDPRAAGRTLGFVADVFPGAAESCATCHADPHRGKFDPGELPAQVDGRSGCARCHDSESFRFADPRSFDHGRWTSYALEGEHAALACEACHVPARERADRAPRLGAVLGSGCEDCHADPHVAQFGAKSCDACHASSKSFADLRFDHERDARFRLDERHEKLSCATCHKLCPLPGGGAAVRYRPLGLTCVDCHGFEKGGGR